MQGILTVDNLTKEISTEAGVRLKPTDLLMRRLMDGFQSNQKYLTTMDAQKRAAFAVCTEIAKCRAAAIDPVEDFDLLTIVFRAGIPSVTINVSALPRILRRKGYIYQDMIVAVPTGGKGRFVEQIADGRRIAIYDDGGDLPPLITPDNLTNGSIDRFAMRISIGRAAGEMLDFWDYIPTSEIIAAANASENGLYKAGWQQGPDGRKHRAILTDKDGNPIKNDKPGPWTQFASTMVKKVCMRRLQKTIKETFPDVGAVMDAVAKDDEPAEIVPVTTTETPAEVVQTYSWDKPNEDQMADISAANATYKSNPQLLLTALENCYKDTPENPTEEDKQRLIAKYYPTLYIAKRLADAPNSNLRAKYGPLVDGVQWLWK